jgi:hypothetical protein
MRKSTGFAFAIVATLSTFSLVGEAAADLRPGGSACLTNANIVYQNKLREADQAATALGRAIKASIAIKWRDSVYKRCVQAYS